MCEYDQECEENYVCISGKCYFQDDSSQEGEIYSQFYAFWLGQVFWQQMSL